MSLITLGAGLLANAAGPPQAGAEAPPPSTGSALINLGQSLIERWLTPSPIAPMTTVMSMGPAMTMAGRMAGAMGGAAIVEAGGAMMGRALSSAMSGMFSRARRPSAARARALVRLVGVEIAAMTLGTTVPMVAYLATRPARRRGISARDVRTTRRVVRFARSITHSLGSSPRSRIVHRVTHARR